MSRCPKAAPHAISAGPALGAPWQLRGCGQSRCHPRAAVLMFYVPSMGVSFPLLGRTRVLSCSRAGVLEVPSGVGTGMLHCDPAA